MKHKYFILSMLFASEFLFTLEAFADQRWYVWTYEYKTVEKGKAEIESYFTLSTHNIGHIKGTMGTEHRIELEVGMTDRFDFSIYQIFVQGPGEDERLEYKGFQLRSRYKIGEKGKYVLDPLIYLEYKGKPDFSEHGF